MEGKEMGQLIRGLITGRLVSQRENFECPKCDGKPGGNIKLKTAALFYADMTTDGQEQKDLLGSCCILVII